MEGKGNRTINALNSIAHNTKSKGRVIQKVDDLRLEVFEYPPFSTTKNYHKIALEIQSGVVSKKHIYELFLKPYRLVDFGIA
jgi:hypothetical protein